MNKTHELLLNIKNLLSKDNSILDRISPDDIIGCVYVEFDALKDLYNKEQEHEIFQSLTELSAEMSNCIAKKDYHNTIAVFDRIISIHNSFPDSSIALDFIEEANFNKEYIRHREQKTIIVLGDSHVNFLSGNEELSFKSIGRFIDVCHQANSLPLTCIHLGANLAYTSDNSESSSGFRNKIDYLMEHFFINGAIIVTSLGEIDIRAHVFKETGTSANSYQNNIDEILRHYESFLSYLKEKGYRPACWGPIATQKDDTPLAVDIPRYGTEQDRNKATEYFNAKLEKWCNDHDLPFMTMFYDMVTDDYETKEEFLSSDRFHLGQYSYDLFLNSLFLTRLLEERK